MTYIQPKYDPSLLNATPAEKLDYFRRKIFLHKHISSALNLALDNVDFSSKGEIVAIVGPVGVGTTQLGRGLWRHFRDLGNTGSGQDKIQTNVPAIGLEAPSHAGRIDRDYWKRLFGVLLHRGGDILIDRKLYVPPGDFMLAHSIPFADPLKGDIDTLLNASAKMMSVRQTKVLLINQAERLFPESDPAGCTRSQQTLMDLAAQTDARIVLIGGYRLVRASCVRDNWLRRQHMVHFRRYDWSNKQEYTDFLKALTFLLANLPTEQRLHELSVEGVRKLYICSVGCIGTLKKMLDLALQHALRTGEKMSESFILGFALNNAVTLEIAKEALMGEQLLLDIDTSTVEAVLSGGSLSSGEDGYSEAPVRKQTGKSSKVNPSRPGSRRIGERKSSRDPVGGRGVESE